MFQCSRFVVATFYCRRFDANTFWRRDTLVLDFFLRQMFWRRLVISLNIEKLTIYNIYYLSSCLTFLDERYGAKRIGSTSAWITILRVAAFSMSISHYRLLQGKKVLFLNYFFLFCPISHADYDCLSVYH